MTRSRIRTTGPLGTAVVVTFLLGFLSAPLRPCVSHQGHAHHDAVGGGSATAVSESPSEPATHHGHTHADAPGATDGEAFDSGVPAEGGAPSGCECLGLCQLETSPFLPLGAALAHAITPASDLASWRNIGDGPVVGSLHATPLARGPPPLA